MSDHFSGPRALAEPIADITDFFAFPSPEQSGHLVLVMNTLPYAPPAARFSDGLVYRFRIVPVAAGVRGGLGCLGGGGGGAVVVSPPPPGGGGRGGAGERRKHPPPPPGGGGG